VRIGRELGLPPLELLVERGATPDLRALRLAAGLRAVDMARLVPTSRATYRKWEAGLPTRPPSPYKVEAMARLLGVPVEEVEAALRAAR
jgi:transcriptional regulator with XRE-family HTH domain